MPLCWLFFVYRVGNSILLCICRLINGCKTSVKRVLSSRLHKIEKEGPRADGEIFSMDAH